jgi:hypothetical protein
MTPTASEPDREQLTEPSVLPFVRSARRRAPRATLPLPDNVALVTDMQDLLWSVVSRNPRTGERVVLGMVTRRGTGYEATVLGDPIQLIAVASLAEAAALMTNAGPDRGTVRRFA